MAVRSAQTADRVHLPTAYDRFDSKKRNSWIDDLLTKIDKGKRRQSSPGPSRSPSPIQHDDAELEDVISAVSSEQEVLPRDLIASHDNAEEADYDEDDSQSDEYEDEEDPDPDTLRRDVIAQALPQAERQNRTTQPVTNFWRPAQPGSTSQLPNGDGRQQIQPEERRRQASPLFLPASEGGEEDDDGVISISDSEDDEAASQEGPVATTLAQDPAVGEDDYDDEYDSQYDDDSEGGDDNAEAAGEYDGDEHDDDNGAEGTGEAERLDRGVYQWGDASMGIGEVEYDDRVVDERHVYDEQHNTTGNFGGPSNFMDVDQPHTDIPHQAASQYDELDREEVANSQDFSDFVMAIAAGNRQQDYDGREDQQFGDVYDGSLDLANSGNQDIPVDDERDRSITPPPLFPANDQAVFSGHPASAPTASLDAINQEHSEIAQQFIDAIIDPVLLQQLGAEPSTSQIQSAVVETTVQPITYPSPPPDGRVVQSVSATTEDIGDGLVQHTVEVEVDEIEHDDERHREDSRPSSRETSQPQRSSRTPSTRSPIKVQMHDVIEILSSDEEEEDDEEYDEDEEEEEEEDEEEEEVLPLAKQESLPQRPVRIQWVEDEDSGESEAQEAQQGFSIERLTSAVESGTDESETEEEEEEEQEGEKEQGEQDVDELADDRDSSDSDGSSKAPEVPDTEGGGETQKPHLEYIKPFSEESEQQDSFAGPSPSIDIDAEFDNQAEVKREGDKKTPVQEVSAIAAQTSLETGPDAEAPVVSPLDGTASITQLLETERESAAHMPAAPGEGVDATEDIEMSEPGKPIDEPAQIHSIIADQSAERPADQVASESTPLAPLENAMPLATVEHLSKPDMVVDDPEPTTVEVTAALELEKPESSSAPIEEQTPLEPVSSTDKDAPGAETVPASPIIASATETPAPDGDDISTPHVEVQESTTEASLAQETKSAAGHPSISPVMPIPLLLRSRSPTPTTELREEAMEETAQEAIQAVEDLPDPHVAPPDTSVELPIEAGDILPMAVDDTPSLLVEPPSRPHQATSVIVDATREDTPPNLPDPGLAPPDTDAPQVLSPAVIQPDLKTSPTPSLVVEAPGEAPDVETISPVDVIRADSPILLPDPRLPPPDAFRISPLDVHTMELDDDTPTASIIVEAPADAGIDTAPIAVDDEVPAERPDTPTALPDPYISPEETDRVMPEIPLAVESQRSPSPSVAVVVKGSQADVGALRSVTPPEAWSTVEGDNIIADMSTDLPFEFDNDAEDDAAPAMETDDLNEATVQASPEPLAQDGQEAGEPSTSNAPLESPEAGPSRLLHHHRGSTMTIPTHRHSTMTIPTQAAESLHRTPPVDRSAEVQRLSPPVTRSHCFYCKLRLREDDLSAIVLVPQCTLSDLEKLRMETSEAMGEASSTEEADARMRVMTEENPIIHPRLAIKLHRIVGLPIFDEGHCYLLSADSNSLAAAHSEEETYETYETPRRAKRKSEERDALASDSSTVIAEETPVSGGRVTRAGKAQSVPPARDLATQASVSTPSKSPRRVSRRIGRSTSKATDDDRNSLAGEVNENSPAGRTRSKKARSMSVVKDVEDEDQDQGGGSIPMVASQSEPLPPSPAKRGSRRSTSRLPVKVEEENHAAEAGEDSPAGRTRRASRRLLRARDDEPYRPVDTHAAGSDTEGSDQEEEEVKEKTSSTPEQDIDSPKAEGGFAEAPLLSEPVEEDDGPGVDELPSFDPEPLSEPSGDLVVDREEGGVSIHVEQTAPDSSQDESSATTESPRASSTRKRKSRLSAANTATSIGDTTSEQAVGTSEEELKRETRSMKRRAVATDVEPDVPIPEEAGSEESGVQVEVKQEPTRKSKRRSIWNIFSRT